MSNDLPSVGTEDARRLADEIEPLTRKCRPDNLTQGVAARALRLLAAERDELAGRVGELEGDAKRLDWIEWAASKRKVEIARSILGTGYEIGEWTSMSVTVKSGTMREVIDAAISAKKETT